jgi:two-component system CheB/CheR fusion protein
VKRGKAQGSKKPTATPGPARVPPFPVVGVGASAGGLEAFTQLLGALPPDTGMALVLIQHLDPAHRSFLREALARATQMPVVAIQDGMEVAPNHVYVIPPNVDVGILHGTLAVLAQHRERDSRKPHMPIDFFFRALAADRGCQAIALVLSGTATDGTEGLRAIKAEDGVTFAQDPQSAKFGGMPQSAVAAGVVDLCLPIPKIAEELVRLARHPYLSVRQQELPAHQEVGGDLEKVFVLLRSAVGVDFSEYKSATIKRRLARRMALRKVESLRDYVGLLKEDTGEVQALYEDILIHVTSLFREADVFEKLKERVFLEIARHKRAGSPVRMWVTGCSTGEEVYSLAISFLEFLGESSPKVPMQIFGSDLSEQAIQKARAGLYSESAVRDLDPERLRRFFTKVESGYRISQAVRDLCVFVRHDLGHDPPFSKLDLVSCRNVLIYFNQELQKRVLATIHYCLNQPGFLLLGRTENVSSYDLLFSTVDKVNKIFARTALTTALQFPTAHELHATERQPAKRFPLELVGPTIDVSKQVDNLLLAHFAPAGVIVNERMEILQFRGRTGPYLEQASGLPQINLLKMVREGLLAELQVAFGRAKKEMTEVRRKGVQVQQNGSTRTCNLIVMPVTGVSASKEPLFAVLFEEAAPAPAREEKELKPAPGKARKRESPAEELPAGKLQNELKATKEYLQSLIEEHQKTNDALSTANEELVSGNEELQSLNEEHETAKEELQSANEELTTLNEELQNRYQELNHVNNDLLNLLASSEIPILILDSSRRIRRLTPKARDLMNLLPSDVGRPIDDIRPNITVANLDRQIAEVMDTVTMKESEVQDRDGRWHRMQIRPYKTTENKIDGVVLSLVDIDIFKRGIIDAEWARDYATSLVEAVPAPLVVLDEKVTVISSNESFYEVFGVTKSETEGRSLFELGIGQWEIPVLRASLGEVLAKNSRIQNVEVDREFPHLGRRTMSLSARPVHSRSGKPMMLLAIEDVTDTKRRAQERAELLRQTQEARAAEEANRMKDVFLATLSHELRTPLTSVLIQAQLLCRGKLEDAKIRRAGEAIERAVKVQMRLVDELLDISRIITGKFQMELQLVDLATVVRTALDTVSAMADKKSVALESILDESVGRVSGDPARLQQTVWNLLVNAINFTPQGGRVTIALEPVDGRARIQVRDTGVGIEQEFLPHIFDRFVQAERTITRSQGGLGLGLAIVRHLVSMHGGTVLAESAGKDKGATFTVTLPLIKARPAIGPAESPMPSGRDLLEVGKPAELNGMRMLVVDDDPESLEALVEILSQAGAEVRTAASAAEAMRVLEEFEPQVLVSDIAMPREDGYSLLRRIRALGPEQGGDIPALALTALAGEDDRQRALSAGFQMHLAKPVDFDRLEAALMELCERARRPRSVGHYEEQSRHA